MGPSRSEFYYWYFLIVTTMYLFFELIYMPTDKKEHVEPKCLQSFMTSIYEAQRAMTKVYYVSYQHYRFYLMYVLSSLLFAEFFSIRSFRSMVFE